MQIYRRIGRFISYQLELSKTLGFRELSEKTVKLINTSSVFVFIFFYIHDINQEKIAICIFGTFQY